MPHYNLKTYEAAIAEEKRFQDPEFLEKAKEIPGFEEKLNLDRAIDELFKK